MQDTAIVCIYRSPSNSNTDEFVLQLSNLLDSLKSFSTVIISGDINIDIKTTSIDQRRDDYLNQMAFQEFLPAHNFPTREGNCLDHLFSHSKIPSTTLVIESPVTDHYATFICLYNRLSREPAIT